MDIKNYRSAKTGKFVTKEFADRHPATTVGERINIVQKKK